MNPLFKKLTLGLVCIVAILTAHAQPHNSKIHVAINGNDSGSIGLIGSPFRKIQSAINYSVNGDTIVVGNGIYYENLDIGAKAINLQGGGPQTTIIDGNKTGIGIIVRSSASTIDGFSIRNTSPPSYQIKWVSSYGFHTSGTGIFSGDQSARPSIKNCWIYDNEIGIYGNANLMNCKIYNNITGYDGYWVHPIIDRCIFNNNTTALAISNAANSILRNCLMYSNTKAIYLRADLNAWGFRFDIINSTIVNNQSILTTLEGIKTFITNSIIYGNINKSLPFNQQYDSAFIKNSLIELAKNAVPLNSWGKVIYDSLTNKSSNPYFTDTISYNISSYSPAIGSGTAIGTPSIDLNGNPRPNPAGTNPDIGAYENALGIPIDTSCNYTFTTLPANASLVKGSNHTFNSFHTGNYAYQWQSDAAGLGWQNIPNLNQYSGANSNNLILNAISVSNHKQRFRVIASKTGCADTAVAVILNVIDVAKDSADLVIAKDSIAKLNQLLVNKHDTLYVGSNITTDTLKISIRTGLSSASAVLNSIKVYPNPAATVLHIDLEKPGNYIAKLSGITGQTVVSPTSGTIDISSLANGVYVLTIYDSNNKLISTNKISIIK
jgi:hypothetical protein